MTIPIHKEPDEMYDNTHILEHCVFCQFPTRHWHKGTNNPVCPACASIHKVAELHNWLNGTNK